MPPWLEGGGGDCPDELGGLTAGTDPGAGGWGAVRGAPSPDTDDGGGGGVRPTVGGGGCGRAVAVGGGGGGIARGGAGIMPDTAVMSRILGGIWSLR